MKIKVLPQNIEIQADPNQSLMQTCHDNGIAIRSLCKGQPSCAECRVHIVQGEYNVSPPSRTEMSVLGSNYFLDGRRLACQVRVFGDITIDVKEQLERADSPAKKVRGFRHHGGKGQSQETKAVLDTMVLKESQKDQKK